MSPGPVALQVNVALVPSVTVLSGMSLISKERERKLQAGIIMELDKGLLYCRIGYAPY